MGNPFRIVSETEVAPITDDETATAELNTLWKAAQKSYSDLLGKVGMAGNLRWLITAPPHPLVRGSFSGMAKTAREIAAQATALADDLDHAANVYDRRRAK